MLLIIVSDCMAGNGVGALLWQIADASRLPEAYTEHPDDGTDSTELVMSRKINRFFLGTIWGMSLQIEYAELSLVGGREENQDRVLVLDGDDAALVIVIDGMGGHADGARAAEVASQSIGQAFERVAQPLLDPQGFLHRAIGQAHQDLVILGSSFSVEARPRATCVAFLVQDGSTYWGHVGDSRIYLLRNQQIHERTRDHSHVELLLQEGLITEEEIIDHPMRNFVECCLGGDMTLPGMNITGHKKLLPGDTLLACTDGFWSGLSDEDVASLGNQSGPLNEALRLLGERAVKNSGQYADNTSAVALRWMG